MALNVEAADISLIELNGPKRRDKMVKWLNDTTVNDDWRRGGDRKLTQMSGSDHTCVSLVKQGGVTIKRQTKNGKILEAY